MFEEPRLKIKRANHHIDDFNTLFQNLVGQDGLYRLFSEENPAGVFRLVARVGQLIPEEAPLILGDAIHNLRSALDLMACDIVRAFNETPDRHTKFPFRDSEQKLIAALNGGKIKAAGSGVVDLIAKVIQPYPGGNGVALYALHDADIDDKHLLIRPVIGEFKLTGVTASSPQGAFYNQHTFIITGEGQLGTQRASAPYEVHNQGQASFSIFFDKGNPFSGNPIVPTLHQLSQLVSGVVDSVEKKILDCWRRPKTEPLMRAVPI